MCHLLYALAISELTCSRLMGFHGNWYVNTNTRRVSSIPQMFHFQPILMIYGLLDFRATTLLPQAIKPEKHIQDPIHVRDPSHYLPTEIIQHHMDAIGQVSSLNPIVRYCGKNFPQYLTIGSFK